MFNKKDDFLNGLLGVISLTLRRFGQRVLTRCE